MPKKRTLPVPEGLNDSSLARSAWRAGREDPSRRVRCDAKLWPRVLLVYRPTENSTRAWYETLIIPYPPGRILSASFPGTSCQATIIQSLRDRERSLLRHPSKYLLSQNPIPH